MIEKIQQALSQLFEQQRIVFWYDQEAKMTDIFEALDLQNVKKVKITNNEFGIKHRVLLLEPKQAFLLYQDSPKSNNHDNWLLDLNLAYREFHTEAASLFVQELGLDAAYKDIIQAHEPFFSSKERLEKFKRLLEPESDDANRIRIKLLAVLCACEPERDKIYHSLFAEMSEGKSERFQSFEKANLTDFFWQMSEKRFAYKSSNPSIKDLALNVFQNNFLRSTAQIGSEMPLNKDAHLFADRWKENAKAQDLYKQLSKTFALQLNIEDTLLRIHPEDLLASDTYENIDKHLLQTLRDHIKNGTLIDSQVQEWINKRCHKIFYPLFENSYNALSYASLFLSEIKKVDLSIDNAREGFERYAKQGYLIDLLYRKYIYFSDLAEHQGLLKALTKHIESAYTNSFLLPLSQQWQSVVDGMTHWNIEGVLAQKDFYSTFIKPYTESNNKRIFVIISDAFRYESAIEYRDITLKVNRYTADVQAMLGSLPSYTQLGMASLLPYQNISFDKQNDTVFVDGQSTIGKDNRDKILKSHYSRSMAIGAEAFLKLHAKDAGRDFIKPFDVIYIYHNGIDKIGDDTTSEHKVFAATEDEFKVLNNLIKQITSMNGSNIIITSDHGYLYQHNRLDESDFSDFTPEGSVYKHSRRFVIGKNLKTSYFAKKFVGEQAGFSDDTEIQIPKGINRLRIQGAGSRFVHGGASLQEIVIPVMFINKKRSDDTKEVEIDILSRQSSITSNTYGVNFYQKEVVADKVLGRKLKIGFYTTQGKLISDSIEILFDSNDTDSAAREKRHLFSFISEASHYNKQDVLLRMESQVSGTNTYSFYKEERYRMLIAFGSDFDDF
jgi:uncharacterized protein (TIGR02687 family)